MKSANSALRLLNLTILLSSSQKLFKKYIPVVIVPFTENKSELNEKVLKSLRWTMKKVQYTAILHIKIA